MKTITTLLLSFFIFQGVNAQDFSFQLRFKDFQGVTSSVIMGYDETATNGIDDSFQEIDLMALNHIWFGPLEARVGDKLHLNGVPAAENTFLSKKQIVQKNCAFNTTDYYNSVQFVSDNYPLTIKWDKSLFADDSCHALACFVPRQGFSTAISPLPLYLSEHDSIIVKPAGTGLENVTIYTANSDGSLSEHFGIETYIKDGAPVSLINFTFKKGTLLSVNELASDPKFKMFPNPVASGEVIHVETDGSYEIIDRTGRIIRKGMIENHQIPTKSIVAGNYILRVDSGKSTLHQPILIE